MDKLGIMGGTFNPIHCGHLLIAKSAYKQYNLDRVIFIPSGNPPHKQGASLASEEDRLAMTRLATAEYDYFSVSDIELQKKGYSYTWETLRLLRKEYPDTRFYFILGADSLFYFDKWRHPERILSDATLLVANRNDSDYGRLAAYAEKLRQRFGGEIDLITCPKADISSTQIREGRFDKRLVPQAVCDYIDEHGLYTHKEAE